MRDTAADIAKKNVEVVGSIETDGTAVVVPCIVESIAVGFKSSNGSLQGGNASSNGSIDSIGVVIDVRH